MAEKYGEVPPKFTKNGGNILGLLQMARYNYGCSCSYCVRNHCTMCDTSEIRYECCYAGHMNYSEEEINKLKEIISERISDIDGNGENSVLLSTLVFADNAGSEEYDYAIQTKLDLTFYGRLFIYLSYGQG